MAQLRRSNRHAVVDNCQGHEIPTVPASRKSAENFCRVHGNMLIHMADSRNRIRHAGRKVVSKATQENIDKLRAEKDNLNQQKDMLMAHIITCETCI